MPCSSVPETMSTSWPGHPHVPAEHVGGHAETGHVADVARAVGVRPGDGGQDMGHGLNPRRPVPQVCPRSRTRASVDAMTLLAEDLLLLLLDDEKGTVLRTSHAEPLLGGAVLARARARRGRDGATKDEHLAHGEGARHRAPPPATTRCWSRRWPVVGQKDRARPGPGHPARQGAQATARRRLAERGILERASGQAARALPPRTTWPSGRPLPRGRAYGASLSDVLVRGLTPTSAPPRWSRCSPPSTRRTSVVARGHRRHASRGARQGDRRGRLGGQGGQGRRSPRRPRR